MPAASWHSYWKRTAIWLSVERPSRLAQDVVELVLPLGGQETDDLVATLDERVAIAPQGVDAVRTGNTLRIAGVPGLLGGPGPWPRRSRA